MAFSVASTALLSLSVNREIHKKYCPIRRHLKTWSLGRTRVKAGKELSSVCEPLPPDRPLWFPGSSSHEQLDGSGGQWGLPGDFGFDPLGLVSDPKLLKWFAQAELMHSRWAMLAVAGILIPEVLESLRFIENFSWYDTQADMINPGRVDTEPKLPHITNPKPNVGYLGGLWFDFAMWGRGSPEPVLVLRTKKIKNGRLEMLAFVGFVFQAIYTGEGPIDNLKAYLADPGHCNIFSVSKPLTRFH
ncbi:Chlorophyll A-B binding protein [Dillenia turbinata]|uniref:Chlorophyll a-b binding protein, chloroplastic n=1 Tax=Dillenia turbinata TaxID=194707 RepID=A0AAN8W8N3_9MAGN